MPSDYDRSLNILSLWLDASREESKLVDPLTRCLREVVRSNGFAANQTVSLAIEHVLNNLEQQQVSIDVETDQALTTMLDIVSYWRNTMNDSVKTPDRSPSEPINEELRTPRHKRVWDWKSERKLIYLNKIYPRKWKQVQTYLGKWSPSQIKDKARRSYLYFDPSRPDEKPEGVSSSDEDEEWIVRMGKELQ